MINRNKLEHILEYAKQQRHIGQSCKVPPEDMVEIMERLLSACNSPVITDGYVMVPVEPNGDMLAAAQDAFGETDGDIASTLRAAMLQAKSLTSINPAPALVSLQKNAKSLTGNSPVNDVTAGKPLTIFLPDISSKAFWSGAGKNETFHPETYRRWAKKAIERGCIIACIDVEVK